MLWPVIVALIALIVAYLFYKVGTEVLEDEHQFMTAVFVLIIIFSIIGITFMFVLPKPGGIQ